MRPLPTFLAEFCAAAMLCDHCAKAAEIILDDFVDPAMVVSPAVIPGTQNDFLETVGVGSLDAVRSMRIFYAFGDPIGTADAHLTTPSVLTGDIPSLVPESGNSPLASLNVTYSFDSTDFTAGGKNDALFFDFLQLTSEIPPSQFTTSLNDFFVYNSSLKLSSGPFTVAVPFERFLSRGGHEALDPTDIDFLSFALRASLNGGGGPDPLNFHVELDRIRAGRIPEPPTLACGFIFSIVGCGLRPAGEAAVCVLTRTRALSNHPFFGTPPPVDSPFQRIAQARRWNGPTLDLLCQISSEI